MFIYEGKNPESNQSLRKEFEDEYEASSFGRENAYKYPVFTVIDTDDDDAIVDSNQIAEDDETSSLNMMFPDE